MMEYQKIINLFDNTSDQLSKFKFRLKKMIDHTENTTLVDKLNSKLQ